MHKHEYILLIQKEITAGNISSRQSEQYALF